MMQPLMTAAQRLADALRAENEALSRLDLAQAAALANAKQQASEAFTAAYDAARSAGAHAEGAEREQAEEVALQLRDLSAENRRLLERAIALQSRVIETILGVARTAGPGTYGEHGALRDGGAEPFAVFSRA